MENPKIVQDTLQSYEAANEALVQVLDKLDPQELDFILEKQQNRLEQIFQRMYHEEKTEDQSELIAHTLKRYEMANRHLFEHWETIPFGERLNLMQRQWNRLQDIRNRIVQ